MNKDELIHWSDWSSQPSIRIACTQKGYLPWTTRTDIPPKVYEVPPSENLGITESILYTFDHHLVTCPDCLNLDSYKQSSAYWSKIKKNIERKNG
jgi:hypothetical protein